MNDLDKLAAAADSMGTAPADTGPAVGMAEVESPTERNTRALCTLLALAREATASPLILDPPLTTLKRHLADDKLPALAGPWGAVLTHYGVDMLGGFDHPLAVAALTTGPQLWAILSELRDELKSRRAKPITEPDSADPGRPE